MFDDIRVYLAGEPDDKRARALAARWQEALQTTYAQGDRALQANLTAAYAQLADRADVTAEARAWLDSVRAAAIFAQGGA